MSVTEMWHLLSERKGTVAVSRLMAYVYACTPSISSISRAA